MYEKSVTGEKLGLWYKSVLNMYEFYYWLATLSGALVGGIIVYLTQCKALREKRKQRQEDHKRSQQVLGYTLIVKLIKINSNFRTLHQHLEKSFADGKKLGTDAEPWQFVLPLSSLPNPVFFAAEETGMLMAMGGGEVFNLVLTLEAAHNVQLDSLRTYQNLRASLTEKIHPDSEEGPLLSTTLSQKQRMALRPKMIDANSIIEQARGHISKGFEDSKAALEKTQNLLNDKLEFPYKLDLASSNQKAVT